MNEFERVRRRIWMHKNSPPFLYYVKINQNFKDIVVSSWGLANYEEFISIMNNDAGMEVVKGDYIMEDVYIFLMGYYPTDVIDLVSSQPGLVSEIKVSNSIKDVLTFDPNNNYPDFTTSLMNIEDINTSDPYDEKFFHIYSIEILDNGTYLQGALEKLTLPKNINNTSSVGVYVRCYLDSRDVEIIYSTDMRVACLFDDYKFHEGNPTNKFILKVPTNTVAAYTSMYSQLQQSGQLYANYQIVGY